MILITGPGRSGTSLIASIYRELGYDPGGAWDDSVDAGYEDPDIVRLNNNLKRELKLSTYRLPGPLRRISRRYPRVLSPLKAVLSPNQLDWRRLDRVLSRYGGTLRDVADSYAVVKDPDMSSLLPVWAAAGANIEYVLVAMRSSSAMMESRTRASLTDYAPHHTRNAIAYGVGMLVTALYDYNIPHGFVRFEEWTGRPETLFREARFPAPVSFDDFLCAFERCTDRTKITGS